MTASHMTDAQIRVFNEAKRRLKNETWYRGVCCDNFPTHQECVDDFEQAVRSVIGETALWDDDRVLT